MGCMVSVLRQAAYILEIKNSTGASSTKCVACHVMLNLADTLLSLFGQQSNVTFTVMMPHFLAAAGRLSRLLMVMQSTALAGECYSWE